MPALFFKTFTALACERSDKREFIEQWGLVVKKRRLGILSVSFSSGELVRWQSQPIGGRVSRFFCRLLSPKMARHSTLSMRGVYHQVKVVC